MDLRKAMENELKSIVVPALRSAGFTGSLPHFRRLATERVELLTFQFDRHGGGFVIEAAWCGPDGVVTSWGKAIPAAKVTAHDLHPNFRLRIKAAEAVQNKSGKNVGKRGIWFNGTKTNRATGQKEEYVKERYKKYVCRDFSRLLEPTE